MRMLNQQEIGAVAGGGDNNCSAGDPANNYGGVTDTGSVGDDLVAIYEGVVAATSHVIERVANALSD